jgi:ABC-type antimicrobial peptide transport system permease subunit
VVAYNVAQRAREIAVRIAIGATERNVMTMILREALTMSGAGIALGILLALLSTRVLSGILFGVSASDPLTLASIGALLLAVTLLAAYLPGRRAALTDPNIVLRSE